MGNFAFEKYSNASWLSTWIWWSQFYQGKEVLQSLNKAGCIQNQCASSYLPQPQWSRADLSQLRILPWVQALKENNKIESCFQLSWKSKVKVQEDSRASSPRQPFSWLLTIKHNLEQFLSPTAASKQQKWTVLRSLTMTVCTQLYWPQKAVVALLSLVSLTSCFFLWEDKKKGKLARVLGLPWAQASYPVCVGVPVPGQPLHLLLRIIISLFEPPSFTGGRNNNTRACISVAQGLFLTRSSFATVWIAYTFVPGLLPPPPSLSPFLLILLSLSFLSMKLLLFPNPPSLQLNWITPLSNTGQVGGEAANGKHFSFWL